MSSAVFTPSLYPPPRAFRTQWLPAPGGHELWVQESGCEAGIPALVLHGGPGSGCSPLLARFFDPGRYRVVCVDQRGAGHSRPSGGIEHNTLVDLLGDLRRVRARLGIDQWLVVGGSWGATLALLHAVDEPEAVIGLLLRSVFLARAEDVNEFFGIGTEAGRRQWDECCPATGGEDVVDALAAIFAHGPLHRQREAAQSWWQWEQARSGLVPQEPSDAAAVDALIQRYRIQSHYLHHHCWLDEEPLLDRCDRLPLVPTLILHGTVDGVCRPEAAAALQRRLPHAGLHWLPDVGHDAVHPEMVRAMVRALDMFAEQGKLE